MRLILTLLLAAIAGGCSTFGDHFFNLRRENGKACIQIQTAAFWEMGNEASELYEHLVTSTQVIVNGEILGINSINWTTSLILVPVYSEQRDLLGSHGGSSVGCLDLTTLSEPVNVIAVRSSTISGEMHTGVWVILN